MATALKEPDYIAEYLEATAANNAHTPIPTTYAGPAPQQVIVRDIWMQQNGTLLDFFYTIPRPRGPVPAGGIQEVIDELIGVVPLAGIFASVTAVKENPLDLRVTVPSFVVFRLNNSWDWQFNPGKPAASNKVAAHNANYGGLRHVLDSGVSSEPPVPACHIVYFIANAPGTPYFHGFNLEVELAQSPGSLGQPRAMQITIDPDIRNPGGSDG